MTDTQKYYKPSIRVEGPTNAAKNGYRGKLPDGTRDGFIRTDIEKDVIIQRVSKDLYANPASGIRELYVNEVRACQEASGHGADPYIKLCINTDTRQIVLEGVDSMGIPWKTFRDVCCVLGRSTNFDGGKSGQFGMGMYAYTCISDIMFLETHSRETAEKYTVMGKGGIGFDTGLKEPDMGHFGTRVRLTANPDVNLYHVIEMVKKCALLSGTRTIMELDGSGYEYNRLSHLLDEGGEMRSSSISEIASIPHMLSQDTIFHRDNIRELNRDDLDVAFNVCMGNFVESGTSESYICGVPIEYKYDGRYAELLSSIIVNIKDERKYNPTPDRERMKEESAEKLNNTIDSMLESHIAGLNSTNPTLEEYVGMPEMRIMDSLYLSGNPEDLAGISPALVPFARLLSVTAGDIEHRIGGKHRGRPLGNILRHSRFVITDRIRRDVVKAIAEHADNVDVVRLKDFDDLHPAFQAEGIRTDKEYMRNNGLRIKRRPRNARKVRSYRPSSLGRDAYAEHAPDELPDADNLVVVGRDEYARLFWIFQSLGHHASLKRLDDYAFARKTLKDMSGSVTFGHWLENVIGNHVVETNRGVMTLRQVFSSGYELRQFNGPRGNAGLCSAGQSIGTKDGILILNTEGLNVQISITALFCSKMPWFGGNLNLNTLPEPGCSRSSLVQWSAGCIRALSVRDLPDSMMDIASGLGYAEEMSIEELLATLKLSRIHSEKTRKFIFKTKCRLEERHYHRWLINDIMDILIDSVPDMDRGTGGHPGCCKDNASKCSA